jgi:DNA-binding response OmpR family regulator
MFWPAVACRVRCLIARFAGNSNREKIVRNPQDEAADLIRDIKAVMPKNSMVVKRLEDNFRKMIEELQAFRSIGSYAALADDEENNWREKVSLTARELDVLTAVTNSGKRGLTIEGIMTIAYSGAKDCRGAENAGVQIYRIRQKFKAAGLADPIETIRGRGYRISTFPRTDAEMGKAA